MTEAVPRQANMPHPPHTTTNPLGCMHRLHPMLSITDQMCLPTAYASVDKHVTIRGMLADNTP